AEKLGAGEILLTSIDKEGTMAGYDLDLIKIVSEAVSIPVIANGGAGTRQHFADAIKIANASAVAASSIFHFSDSNLSQVKSFLNNSGISVRPI
ncbi:MAG: HisA/HisF-related TIM barrel protein, partial [Patescibacteria group bacterium]